MLFEDLQNFLQVRPGHGILETMDDRVVSPFRLPGSEEPVSVSVRAVSGGLFLVHDDGVISRRFANVAAVTASPVFSPMREAWIRHGIQTDEEGRIFTTAASSAALTQAVARILEAQMVLATLCTALAAHG